MENTNSAYEARMLVSRICFEPAIRPRLGELYDRLPKTFGHSIDVAYLAGEVACELELDYAEDIVRGALLHDIGKLRVPYDLLMAARKLTIEEKAILQAHSFESYEMIKDDPAFSDIVKDIALYHHERQDGSGYPEGKSSKDLKKAVKIVTVCDIYDAMTHKRPYRKAFNAFEALNLMMTEPVDRSILKILKECPDR